MSNWLKKISPIVAIVAVAVVMLLPVLASAATFSTTTLGDAIDDVSGTVYDYFVVLIQKFWPLLLGAGILVGILVFGKRIIHGLFGGK